MKVYNLSCCNQHRFEGWFASEREYRSQSDGGLIACPVCGDQEIRKMPAAPRLNLSNPMAEAPRQKGKPDMQQAWFDLARQLLESTEDVGERFAEEARRMYYRETEGRAIRGITSVEQLEELTEEGIEVMAFPIPPGMKQTLQ